MKNSLVSTSTHLRNTVYVHVERQHFWNLLYNLGLDALME